jgi:hypothetical protein
MAASNTPAEAIAMEIVCMSTILDTNLNSYFWFSYNISAKPEMLRRWLVG